MPNHLSNHWRLEKKKLPRQYCAFPQKTFNCKWPQTASIAPETKEKVNKGDLFLIFYGVLQKVVPRYRIKDSFPVKQ